ncbi:MAG: flagellar hook-length control protein FliK [Thermincolia bacterium]
MQDNLILFSPRPVEPVMGSKVPVVVGKTSGFGIALAQAMISTENGASANGGNLPRGLGQMVTGTTDKGSEAVVSLQVVSGVTLGSLVVTQPPVETADSVNELADSLEGLLELLMLIQQTITGIKQQDQASGQEKEVQMAEGVQGLNLQLMELLNQLSLQGEQLVQLLGQMPNLNPQQEQLVNQLKQFFIPEKLTQLESKEEGFLKDLLVELKALLSPEGQGEKTKDWSQGAGKVEELIKALGGLAEEFVATERAARELYFSSVKVAKPVVTDSEVLPATQQGEQAPEVAAEGSVEKKNSDGKSAPNQQQAETEREANGKGVNLAAKVLEQPVEQFADKLSPEVAVAKNTVEISNNYNKLTIPNMVKDTSHTREQVFQQIMQKVHLLVRGEHAEMNLQLKPDHLGKLNMQVVVENGVITARFAAESMQVKELIEASLNNLKQTLTNQGLKVDEITVSVSQGGDQMAQWSRNRSFTSSKNNNGSANQVDAGYLEPLAVQEYGKGLGVGDSVVDYRI